MNARTIIIIFSLVCCAKQPRNGKSYSDLRGTWVLTNFLDSLAKGKSAYHAYESLSGISCLFIRENISDTTRVGITIYNNQANEIKIVPDTGSATNFTIVDNEAEGYSMTSKLKVSIIGSDTSLTVSYHDLKRPKRDLVFKKISKEIIDNAIDFLAISLFSGLYDVYDSTRTKVLFKDVKLESKGVVKNFDSYDKFNVVADYSVQPEQFDLVVFSSNDDRANGFFTYKFIGEDIFIYEVMVKDRLSQIGKPLYFFKSR